MRVSHHRLIGDDDKPVDFVRSPNQSSKITPEFLVMHYTAGRSAAGAISWLTNKEASASAHLVVAEDGAITQLVAFNRKAWHAGRSRWDGRTGVNDFSIGIELDNPGILQRQGSTWANEWGDKVDQSRVVEAAHKNSGPVQAWYAYSTRQLEVLRDITAVLVDHYELRDVIGHDDVAPLRKFDPGPAFPMGLFRGLAEGRDDDAPEVFVTTAVLNIRSGPGVEHAKLDFSPLPKKCSLEVIGESGVWRHVDVLDEIAGDSHRTGWVHGHYISSGG